MRFDDWLDTSLSGLDGYESLNRDPEVERDFDGFEVDQNIPPWDPFTGYDDLLGQARLDEFEDPTGNDDSGVFIPGELSEDEERVLRRGVRTYGLEILVSRFQSL